MLIINSLFQFNLFLSGEVQEDLSLCERLSAGRDSISDRA